MRSITITSEMTEAGGRVIEDAFDASFSHAKGTAEEIFKVMLAAAGWRPIGMEGIMTDEAFDPDYVSDGRCKTCWFFSRSDSTCRESSPERGFKGMALWPNVEPTDWCGKYKYGRRV